METLLALECIPSDNSAEFTAEAVRGWFKRVGVKTLHTEPGSPMGERVHQEL